jgi:hypothetical protein
MTSPLKGPEIQLLQCFLCREFRQVRQDIYTADQIQTNLYVPRFPFFFDSLYAVTCWRKDDRFHKEVIEYATDYGTSFRSPHMDIEPVTDRVLFRWHTHPFPNDFVIERPTLLTLRIFLDGKEHFKTFLLIEQLPA